MFKMKKNIKKLKSEGSSCIAVAFEIRLSIRQFFFNVRQQIIAEAKLF